jgi:simple sugar transport system ATP-binding protein
VLNAYTARKIDEHRVKATGPSDLAKSLSGGNQQKVVLAREVDLGTKLLVLNQPTRGLDMGAVDRIHKVILDERKAKRASCSFRRSFRKSLNSATGLP